VKSIVCGIVSNTLTYWWNIEVTNPIKLYHSKEKKPPPIKAGAK